MVSEETKQKITMVAETCIRCRRCMKECLMLNRFAQNPKVLFTQYLEQGPENMDRHIAYSCNECSQCTLKCPKGLNLKAVFQSLKADYAAENHGIVPVEELIPSEYGQAKECSPEFCTTLTAGTGHVTHGPAKYVFVPGRFPADPILQHLRSSLGQHNVELLPYTGEVTPGPEILTLLENLGAQVLITACPSSFQALRQTVKHMKILFYWDLMQDLIGIPGEALQQGSDRKLELKGSDQIGDSVRWVLQQLGCQWSDRSEASGLQNADQDCRKVLGLLFGEPPEQKKSAPFPLPWQPTDGNPGSQLRS